MGHILLVSYELLAYVKPEHYDYYLRWKKSEGGKTAFFLQFLCLSVEVMNFFGGGFFFVFLRLNAQA
jgi:hypothetical protein